MLIVSQQGCGWVNNLWYAKQFIWYLFNTFLSHVKAVDGYVYFLDLLKSLNIKFWLQYLEYVAWYIKFILTKRIFHLCRAFDDAEIVHVEGEVDPVRDLQIIHEELRLKDEEFIKGQVSARRRDVERIGKGGNAQDKSKKEEFDTLVKVQEMISTQKKDVRSGEWSGKEIEVINTLQLLTAKPMVYLCNLSERDYARKVF